MKKIYSVFLALALLLPVAGALSLAFVKQAEINRSVAVRLPIKGYDPRSLLYGHYLMFTFDGPKAPDQERHKYFIPEDQAGELQKVLNFGSSQKVEIDTHLKNRKIIHLGMLYIDGMPWRDYFAMVNAYADQAPFVRVSLANVYLSDHFLSFSFKESALGLSSTHHSVEIPAEDLTEFTKKWYAATDVVYGSPVGRGQFHQCGGNRHFQMDVKIRGNDVIRYGMIYIDGKPWREFNDHEAVAQMQTCKKNLPKNQ